jgi:phage gp29-like protein
VVRAKNIPVALQSVARPGVASVPKLGGDIGRFIADRQSTEFLLLDLFGEDPHPSKIVRDKSEPGERVGEVYGRMLGTDATLAGLVDKRTTGVLALPWSIDPGDETPLAREIAYNASKMVENIGSLEVNLRHQLGAVAQGVAIEECRWESVRAAGPLKGLWCPVELVDRPMHRFGFKRGELHIRQRDGLGLTPAPPGRFLRLSHATKDDAWGVAELDKVWWFFWLTLHGWKYYGVAVEKWAQPTVMVPYKRTADEAANEQLVSEALQTAAGLQTEFAMAVPEDLLPKLLEAMRGGSVSYDGFLHLLDRAKALFLLGEVDTSGLSQGPGSFAKNEVSNEVRYETIVADACELSNSLTSGLLLPWTLVNYGVEAPRPRWKFDVEEASDRTLRQAGVQAVLDEGMPVPEAYFYRVHQVAKPRAGEPVVTKRARPQPPAIPPPTLDPAALAADWSDLELR